LINWFELCCMEVIETDIDLEFEKFFKTVDVKRIEAYDCKPFTTEHKERMKQSFIKHDGYPDPFDIWPEIFTHKL